MSVRGMPRWSAVYCCTRSMDFGGVFVALQVVPEHVDLVEHGKTPGPVIGVIGGDVFLPDGHVTGGNAGVGAEQEDDRMGVGQHADGQFRLGTQGVKAWCVENAQAPFE